jgi:hypothetical protein
MSNKIGFARGLSYVGTNADQPPNWSFEKRDPGTYDTNYSIGDLWINEITQDKFVLVSLQGTITSKGQLATWVPWGGGGGAGIVTLSGITNPAVHVPGDPAANVQLTTTIPNLTITGNFGANTITFAMAGANQGIVTSLTDHAGTAVIPNAATGAINMNSTIPGLQFTAGPAASQITLEFTGLPISLVRSLSGDTGTRVYSSVIGNIGITSTIPNLTVDEDPPGNKLILESSTGGGFVETLTGNNGGVHVPIDANGNINVVGDGVTCTVAGNAGTNTLTITTNSTQSICSFYADKTIWQNNVVGGGTPGTAVPVTVGFDRILFNIGAAYDGVDTFTCPYNGIYQFITNIHCEPVGGTSNDGLLFFAINGIPLYESWHINFQNCKEPTYNSITISGSIILNLNAGDLVTIKLRVSGNASNTTSILDRSWFNGALLALYP